MIKFVELSIFVILYIVKFNLGPQFLLIKYYFNCCIEMKHFYEDQRVTDTREYNLKW